MEYQTDITPISPSSATTGEVEPPAPTPQIIGATTTTPGVALGGLVPGAINTTDPSPVPPARMSAAPPANTMLASDVVGQLSVGTEGRVEGLLNAPHLNGLRGTIIEFDASTGRYKIQCENDQFVALKPENFRIPTAAARRGSSHGSADSQGSSRRLCAGVARGGGERRKWPAVVGVVRGGGRAGAMWN